MLKPAEEIRFWTGIMRDHGEFILTSLSYSEQETIRNAMFYRETFAALHERVKIQAGTSDINALRNIINECIVALTSFINFKKVLLAELLQCNLSTSLPPTFYNHMINEAMEFYKVLIELNCNVLPNPLQELLGLHRIWLVDAAGHAVTIANDLDPVEKLIVREAREFEKCFHELAGKANELCFMLTRTCLKDGALEYLNEQVFKKMEEFIRFLERIRLLTKECKVLGVLKPLIPDHMLREENYYLDRVRSVAGTK